MASQKKLEKAMTHFSRAIEQHGNKSPEMRDLTIDFAEQAGGVGVIASAWWEQLRRLLDEAEKSKQENGPKWRPLLILNYLKAVTRMIEVENAQRQDMGDLSNLSDADIRAALRDVAVEACKSDRAFLDEVMKEAKIKVLDGTKQ